MCQPVLDLRSVALPGFPFRIPVIGDVHRVIRVFRVPVPDFLDMMRQQTLLQQFGECIGCYRHRPGNFHDHSRQSPVVRIIHVLCGMGVMGTNYLRAVGQYKSAYFPACLVGISQSQVGLTHKDDILDSQHLCRFQLFRFTPFYQVFRFYIRITASARSVGDSDHDYSFPFTRPANNRPSHSTFGIMHMGRKG